MARLMRQWGLGCAALAGLLLGACFEGDAPLDVPDATSTPPPAATVSTTGGVADGVPTPVVPRPTPEASPTPTPTPAPTATPTPTPTQGADAVVQPEAIVALRLGDRVRVAGTGWAVAFREVVEDSRCPVDMQCIWAGQVVVRLVGEHSDGRVAVLTLTMPAGGLGSSALGDLRVDALGIEPARRAGTPAPESYILHLRIGTPQTLSPSALSGVRGRVTIGPMCPVMRADEPCPDRPYRATLIVRDAAGREIARVESSDDGAYALPLPPGAYVIEPQSPSASRLPWASPQPFEVRASAWTTLDVAFDSGIR